MTQREDDDLEASFQESVLPVEVDKRAVPLPLDKLEPWHSPRKQYIREQQWEYYAKRLIETLKERNSFEAGKLKYFSLPGIDHFDVEIVAKAAQDAQLKLEALGFLSEAAKEPARARSQVRAESLIKKGLMKDTSVTIPYRIEDIARKDSQAHLEVESRAPFHIINIDACGSIARRSAGGSNRIIDAVHRLVELQLNKMRDPWLLFVTTNAQLDNLSREVRSKLEKAIKLNAEDSEAFKEGAINCLGEGNADDIESAIDCANDPLKFQLLFSLGFSKWLLRNVECAGWGVKCLEFYGYSSAADDANQISMPCLAYEFKPPQITLTDQVGIVKTPEVGPVEETDYSMQAITSTQNMENIDALLTKKPKVRLKYAKKQKNLLVSAGYQAAALAEFDSKYINNALEID